MSTDTPVSRFRSLYAEVADLRRAADLVEWDERVCMPPEGAPIHGEMQATLRRLAHEAFTRDDMGSAIAALAREAESDTDLGRLAAVAARDYDRALRVPASFVAEYAEVISASQHAWERARAQNDFHAFAVHFERVLDLKRRYVDFFPPAAHPYDVLLDEYEPGMTTADVRALFDALRPRQVALIAAIAKRPPVDAHFLRDDYPEAEMLAFAVKVATAIGFDWARGRQDKSVHPFATSIGSSDVRITTRWVDGQPFGLLFGTMHETGHALYEQGIGRQYHRTPLEGGTSLGVHESQSRLWENVIGRSRGFWQHFFPALQTTFPPLASVTAEQFYRGINEVQPSLVRVEADEATYNLHVMLRTEIEIGLIEGTVAIADLPGLWEARMQAYLGLVPPNDTLGVLQDVHWSAGLFGYFPTYTLGNVIAAQLWDRWGALNPDRDRQIAAGEFGMLLSWLRNEVHQHGRAYHTQALVERITSSPVDPDPYLRYLEEKYGDVYGL